MSYKHKKITFETVLKGKDKSLKGLTDISNKFNNLLEPVDKLNYKLKKLKQLFRLLLTD